MVVETTCLFAAIRASTISFDRLGENRQSLVNETPEILIEGSLNKR
ncbi:MAG: hypothetical protein CM1200mP24_04250 [Gammaproteobacteria bacterium]|nr:MAG: hypothetical protein CM1200mP24_04250 [Gammaproteobacteria bacterium]